MSELARFLMPNGETPVPSDSSEPKPTRIVDLTDQFTRKSIIITGATKPPDEKDDPAKPTAKPQGHHD